MSSKPAEHWRCGPPRIGGRIRDGQCFGILFTLKSVRTRAYAHKQKGGISYA